MTIEFRRMKCARITGGKGQTHISPQTPEHLVPQERAEVLTAEVESANDRVVLR